MDAKLKLSRFPLSFEITPLFCPALKGGQRPSLERFPRKEAGSVLLSGGKDSVFFIRGGQTLYFLFRASSPDGIKADAEKPPLWKDDSCEVFLDAAHDHRNYVHLIQSAAGIKEAELTAAGPGCVRLERKISSAVFPGKWEGSVRKTKNNWEAFFAIDLAELGAKSYEPSSIIGINFVARSSYAGKTAYIGPFPENSAHSPWAFHDLYLAKSPVKVKGVSLGMACLSADNVFTARLDCPAKTKLTASIKTFSTENYGLFYSKSAAFECGKNRSISLKYRLDPHENSYGYSNYQKVSFELFNGKGKRIYNADYMLGYSNGIKLVYGFPGKSAAEPSPDAPDFADRKRLYIMSRLPVFQRKNPGSLIISPEASFDLNDPKIFPKLAALVSGIFKDETDRLLGCTMLLHQPAFLTYANFPSWSGFLEPSSLLRQQLTDCSGFAEVLAELVSHLKIPGGGRYKTLPLSLHGEFGGKPSGHVITLAKYGGTTIPLDSCTGTFFYSRGNGKLASLDELLNDLTLAERGGRNFSVLFSGVKHFYYGSKGKILWP